MEKTEPLEIALVGTYPPPYGGRSIHVQRLKDRLEKEGTKVTVYNLGRGKNASDKNIVSLDIRKGILRYLIFGKQDIIHYHGSNWKLRVIIGMLGLFGKKSVISLHSNVALKDAIMHGSWLRRWLIRFALRRTSFVVVLNSMLKDLVLSLGVKRERVEIIPSFLPPLIKQEEIAQIPQGVWDFIDSHGPIISANAFRISFYNEEDVYGLDLCIDLCAELKSNYPQIGFVFCIPDIGDHEYFQSMKQRIGSRSIENNFLFMTQPCQFYPILMESDLFVRPTNIDAYGVSIAEAIYFKVPAVASDVCPRPDGTILFKSRNIEDFTFTVKDVLDNYDRHKKKLEDLKVADNFEKIVRIYERLGKP
jgi:glycosyltransferase involved in cell wall biosynthesis